MQEQSERNLRLANALRYAVDKNELSLVYQPQMDITGTRIVGAEALLRWNHSELGSIPPADFIPVAEDSGLIISIGKWALRQAIRQMKHWMDDGLHPFMVAVNLSAVQLRQRDFPDLVARMLEEEGLSPEYLELELTEAATMENPAAAVAMISELHSRGIRISMMILERVTHHFPNCTTCRSASSR